MGWFSANLRARRMTEYGMHSTGRKAFIDAQHHPSDRDSRQVILPFDSSFQIQSFLSSLYHKMSQLQTPPPPPKWAVDLKNGLPPRSKTADKIPDPPGYTRALTNKQRSAQAPARKPPTAEETDTLKLKKAWEIALGPAKQLPMQAIMAYMSGNSLQIFSIMMVFMLFKGPIQAIMQTNSAFTRFETDSMKSKMLGVKIVYVLMQCSLLALGIYKVNSMGLLPTTRSDWLAWESERQPLERAYFAFD